MKKIILPLFLVFLGCSSPEQPDPSSVATEPSPPQVFEQEMLPIEPVMAEIKLIDAQDDPRGWCVDLFAHRKAAMPLGGMQGHNCFMYFDIGGPTEDQGFDIALFSATGQLKASYFDVCMEVYDIAPEYGSFVAAEACNGSSMQSFTMMEDGRIVSDAATNLCLTLGSNSVPGGGRLPPPGGSVRPPENNDKIHLIRRLTFDECSDELAELQRWEFRAGDYVPDKDAEPHRFIYSNDR